jgi:hypothetical protein
MTVAFRNVDASPSDPVGTWPVEAIVTVIERGLVTDWRPLLREIREHPRGHVARVVDAYLERADVDGATRLFRLVLDDARRSEDDADRTEAAGRVRSCIEASGLTAARFAEEIGTSASRLSTYATGRVTPSAALLVRMERVAARRG